MNPFIFQFKEQPSDEGADFSTITYDRHLNLNIDSKTGKPAIASLNISTETFTKTQGEDADPENSYVSRLMGTETITLVSSEGTDSDNDRSNIKIYLSANKHTENSTKEVQ
ncbi:hypothetical protein [Sphingobacterium siyangense]|uniref:hypothetical protein n=1 Tax=Sphingobacterium siyangense TaxID=459529 RepID=UPI002FDB4FCB